MGILLNGTNMSTYKKCDWCGRTYKGHSVSSVLFGNGTTTKVFGGISHLAGARNFCGEECKRLYKQAHAKDNSSGGASVEVSSASVAQESAARTNNTSKSSALLGTVFKAEADRRAEIKAQKEEIQAKVDVIKNMVFDTENEENFLHQFISACEDYKGLKAGFFADKDFKSAYVTRMQKELNIPLASKPELHTKVSGYWDDAKKFRAEKEKKIHIISAIVIGASFILGCISGIPFGDVSLVFMFGSSLVFFGVLGAVFLEGLRLNKLPW